MRIDKIQTEPGLDQPQYLMVTVNHQEAMILIKSLSSQIISKNCNSDRAEMRVASGPIGQFSIAVEPDIDL